jgi:hypothetical protein
VDSLALAAPVDSEKVNNTWVGTWHDQKIDVFSQVQECRSNK